MKQQPVAQNLIIFSITLGAFMSTLDSNIVNIALPNIALYFSIPIGSVVWVTLSYLLVLTSTLLLFGRLSDRVGVKKIFLLGYIVFVAGSLMCGISPTIAALIVSRCIQALGGAMIYTTIFAMVPKFIEQKDRGRAFGFISTAAGLGVSVGAPLGGLLTGLFSWHWIFLINIPVGIAAYFLSRRILPEEKVARTDEKFDIAGMLLSFAGPTCLIYALNMGHILGWDSPIITGTILASFFSFLAFVWWEKRARYPLLNMSIFKNKSFLVVNQMGMLTFLFMAGNNFIIPFFLQYEKGLSVMMSGVIFLLYSVVYLVVSPFAGRISDHVPSRILCRAALLSCLLCTLVFCYTIKLPGLLSVMIFLMWLGASMGFFISPNNSEAMSLAPEGSLGIVSGVFKMVTNLGMVIGVAVFEMVFSAFAPPDISLAAYGQGMLLNAFRCTFLVGSIFLFISLAVSWQGRTRRS
ncbi:MAG: MFS transporter [Candidatus Margulisiibacteriota bacterium]